MPSDQLDSYRSLYRRTWQPSEEQVGAVGIVHGLGEHCDRYDWLAARLAAGGFQVKSFDLRGHGHNPGRRGDVKSFDVLLDDVERLLDELREGDGEDAKGASPRFLYGHSFGWSLVLNLVVRREPDIRGVIASSPLLRPTRPPPAWKRIAARSLNLVRPSALFRTGLMAEGLSHDLEAVERYRQDPLVHDRVSARWGLQMLDAGRWAVDHARQLRVPTLLMHGTADPITSCDASREFAERAGARCTLKTWPGLLHELHWEQEREQVVEFVLAWMRGLATSSHD